MFFDVKLSITIKVLLKIEDFSLVWKIGSVFFFSLEKKDPGKKKTEKRVFSEQLIFEEVPVDSIFYFSRDSRLGRQFIISATSPLQKKKKRIPK